MRHPGRDIGTGPHPTVSPPPLPSSSIPSLVDLHHIRRLRKLYGPYPCKKASRNELSCTLLYADPSTPSQERFIHPLYGLPSPLHLECSCHTIQEHPLSRQNVPAISPQAVFGGAPLVGRGKQRKLWIPLSSSSVSVLPSSQQDQAEDEQDHLRDSLSIHPFPRYLYHHDGRPFYYTFNHSLPPSRSLSFGFLSGSRYAPRSLPSPDARSGHVMVVVEDYILIFGGLGVNDEKNDIWAFYPATGRFRQLCVKHESEEKACGDGHHHHHPMNNSSHTEREREEQEEEQQQRWFLEENKTSQSTDDKCRRRNSPMEKDRGVKCDFLRASRGRPCIPKAGFGQACAVFTPHVDHLFEHNGARGKVKSTSEEIAIDVSTDKDGGDGDDRIIHEKQSFVSTFTTCSSSAFSFSSSPCARNRKDAKNPHSHAIVIGGFATGDVVISEAYVFCPRTEEWTLPVFSTPLTRIWGATAQAMKQPRVLPTRCSRCHQWNPHRSPTTGLCAAYDSNLLSSFWFGHETSPFTACPSSSVARFMCHCEVPPKERNESGLLVNPETPLNEGEEIREEEEEEVVVMFGGMGNEEMVGEMYIFHLERTLVEEDIPVLSHLILTGFPNFVQQYYPSVTRSHYAFQTTNREESDSEDNILFPFSVDVEKEKGEEEEEDQRLPPNPSSLPHTGNRRKSPHTYRHLQSHPSYYTDSVDEAGKNTTNINTSHRTLKEAVNHMLSAAVGSYLVEVLPIDPGLRASRVETETLRGAFPFKPSLSPLSLRKGLFFSSSYVVPSPGFSVDDPSNFPDLHSAYCSWVLLYGPQPRRRPCSSVYEDHLLFIFGGRNELTFFNDMWVFNSMTRTWASLSPPSSSARREEMIEWFPALRSGRERDDLASTDPLLRPSSSSTDAAPPPPSPRPSVYVPLPRTGGCMAIDEERGQILVYGGFSESSGDEDIFLFGDFNLYHIREGVWERVKERKCRKWNPILDAYGPSSSAPETSSSRRGKKIHKNHDQTQEEEEERESETVERERQWNEVLCSLPGVAEHPFLSLQTKGLHPGHDSVQVQQQKCIAEHRRRSLIMAAGFKTLDAYLFEVLQKVGGEVPPFSSSSCSSSSSCGDGGSATRPSINHPSFTSASSLLSSYSHDIFSCHQSLFSPSFHLKEEGGEEDEGGGRGYYPGDAREKEERQREAEVVASRYFHLPILPPPPRTMGTLVAVPTTSTRRRRRHYLFEEAQATAAAAPSITAPSLLRPPQRFLLFGGRAFNQPRADVFEITITPGEPSQDALDDLSSRILLVENHRRLTIQTNPPSPPPSFASRFPSDFASALFPGELSDHWDDDTREEEGGEELVEGWEEEWEEVEEREEEGEEVDKNAWTSPFFKKLVEKKTVSYRLQWRRATRDLLLSHLDKCSVKEEKFYATVTLSPSGLWASVAAWLKVADKKEQRGENCREREKETDRG